MLSKFTAYQLAKELFERCKALKIHRIFKDQLFRASSSVALNLAEGSGKKTPADQKRFYSIAQGSLRETHAIIDLNGVNDPKILDLIDQLGAILFTLINKN
jgi:four helix bundle protein